MHDVTLLTGYRRLDGRLSDVRVRSFAGVCAGELRVSLRQASRETDGEDEGVGNRAPGQPKVIRKKEKYLMVMQKNKHINK